MSDVLHLAAVAPAGVAVCCVASGRWRGRRRAWAIEIAVAILMLAAMLDVSRPAPLIAPVLWAALLLAGALALGAGTRRTSRAVVAAASRAPRDAPSLVHGPLHGALGCIAMAALVLVMAGSGSGAGSTGHHGTGALGTSASVLTVVISAGVLAYAAYSVVALRHGPLLQRVQYGAMGLSTLGMAAALLV